jgi:hypothetical protein
MEAVAAPLDELAVDRRRIVLWLNELEVHVTGKAHREPHLCARGLSAVDGLVTGEMLEDEPRADPKRAAPLLDRRMQVRHHVGHLNDAVVGLTEPHLARC